MKLISSGYKFKNEEDVEFFHPCLAGITLDEEFATIKDSVLTVKKDYAWNGCSPFYVVLGIWEFGTPDGAMRNGKPWTYYASLAHDALDQYSNLIPIKRDDSIEIFHDILVTAEFPLADLYKLALDYLYKTVYLGDK